jgi:hypothetical protein
VKVIAHRVPHPAQDKAGVCVCISACAFVLPVAVLSLVALPVHALLVVLSAAALPAQALRAVALTLIWPSLIAEVSDRLREGGRGSRHIRVGCCEGQHG